MSERSERVKYDNTTKYCFLILGDDASLFLSFFLFRFLLLLLLFYVIINFYKNYLIILYYLFMFFRANYFYFFMFWDVPVCSGMFRVPDFIDAPFTLIVSLT